MNSIAASSISASAYPATEHARLNASSAEKSGGCGSCGSGSCGGCGDKKVGAASDAEGFGQLSEEDQKTVAKLKARDREVRAHERAHQAAGGQHAGAASYTTQKGPDGHSYAVGGEVPIDVSEVQGDPAATIDKMRQVKAAALAPAKPSGQDRKVAAMADAKMMKAQAELNANKSGEDDPMAPEGKLEGSLAQQLAEVREGENTSEDESSASTPPDLAAYATNAYRHQAPSIVSAPA
jgi:hypothetical protein